MSLSLLGLNKYESQIYQALVEHPGMTAGEIAKYSKVPQSRVYDVLEQLINKQLVSLIPEMPKKFIPEDPEHLRKLIAKKQQKLAELDRKFVELRKTFVETKKHNVIVTRTARNFDRIIRNLEPAQEFDYSTKPRLSTKPEFIKKVEKQKKLGVDYRVIADESLEDTTAHKEWKKVHADFGFMNTRGVILNITEKNVLISLMPPENDSLIISIESENLAAVLAELFRAYHNHLLKN